MDLAADSSMPLQLVRDEIHRVPRHLGEGVSVDRVPVIEDDDRTARLVSRALSDDGCGVERAVRGHDGLTGALAGDFDLIVCVRRLRMKLDRPDRIETVRNVGYRFTVE
jgi:DNA-binding response OmpR family regulator